MTHQTINPDPQSEIPNPQSAIEFASAYAGHPINRDLVVEFADTLMGVHPNTQEIGLRGMRTVAHLALITGAHPLPGTNGIHAWRDKKGYLCIQFGIGFWRQQGTLAGGILWISWPSHPATLQPCHTAPFFTTPGRVQCLINEVPS